MQQMYNVRKPLDSRGAQGLRADTPRERGVERISRYKVDPLFGVAPSHPSYETPHRVWLDLANVRKMKAFG